MSRKAKSKPARPTTANESPSGGADTPSGESSAAFNYSWRTAATLVGLALTLLVFLAMPFGEDRVPLRRAVFGALALDELPRRAMSAVSSAEFWPTLGERALLFGCAGLLAAIAYALGRATLEFIVRDRIEGIVERHVLSLLLGLAALSTMRLAIADIDGGTDKPVLAGWMWVAILVVVSPVYLVVALRTRRMRTKDLPSPSRAPAEFPVGLWALIGAPAAALALLCGALPPYDFDVLEYHFQIPKEWHQAGGLVRTDGNVYGAMPQGAEMFVLWGMSFSLGEGSWWRGALVGKTILAAFVPLTSLLVASIAARLAGARAGLFAGWIALLVPWQWFVGTSGLVDHVWGAYFLAASWTAFRTWFDDGADGASQKVAEPSAGSPVRSWRLRSSPSLRWAALAGAFFGAACACKYPAVPLVGGPLLIFHVVCFAVVSRRTRAENLEDLRFERSQVFARFAQATTLAAVAAIVLGGPWYFKNLALYGNPVFPLATDMFGDGGWNEELVANWNRAHAVPGDTLIQRWSPATFLGEAWTWLMATPWASPLIPAGLIAFAFAKRAPRAAWVFVGLACGFFVFFWATTHRIDRFLVPTYPLLAVAAGIGLAGGADSIQRLARQVAFWIGTAWCVVVILFVQVDQRLFLPLDRLRVDPKIEGLPARIAPAVQWLNEHAKGTTTLSIGDAAVFDFENPVVYHTCFDDCPLQVWHDVAKGDPAALRATLEERGVGYVYVDWNSIERYRSPGNYGFPFPIGTRESFADLVGKGVLSPPVEVGPPMGEGGPPAWEIYPVPSASPSPPSAESAP